MTEVTTSEDRDTTQGGVRLGTNDYATDTQD